MVASFVESEVRSRVIVCPAFSMFDTEVLGYVLTECASGAEAKVTYDRHRGYVVEFNREVSFTQHDIPVDADEWARFVVLNEGE